MNRTDHVRQMAAYNDWMNTRLYEGTMQLSDEQIAADQGAFFGSLLGTLNHLVVADTIWLKRFLTHPAAWPQFESLHSVAMPQALDQILYPDIRGLRARRADLDKIILQWADAITEHELDHILVYTNMKGVMSDRNFFGLLMHFFNHQTHHRGQATTLLNRYGIDIGVTDLLAILPDLRRK